MSVLTALFSSSLKQKFIFPAGIQLNRCHSRYISGDALECEQSRLARKLGQPLKCEGDCCGSPTYELLRLKPHPKSQGMICQHWKLGLLEILRQEGWLRLN